MYNSVLDFFFMPNSKSFSVKNFDPDRVRAKNDYIDTHEVLASIHREQGINGEFKIKSASTKKYRKRKIPIKKSTSTSSNSFSTNTTNSTNLINLSDKLLGSKSNESNKDSNTLFKLMISNKKINTCSDNEDSFIEIRTLPIDLSPNTVAHKEKIFCRFDNDTLDKKVDNMDFDTKKIKPELICKKCGNCCCYLKKKKKNKKRFQNCIDLCTCVYCLRLAANSNSKSTSSLDMSSSSSSLSSSNYNCCCNGDENKKSSSKNRKKNSLNRCLRITCLSTLALTLMPCLLFYWPLRLLNELLMKTCYCGSNFEDSCKCDNCEATITTNDEKNDKSLYFLIFILPHTICM
jgi:hypothetical protein